jgi:hypothetical protein
MPATERDLWELFCVLDDYIPPIYAFIEWIHPAIQNIGKSQMSKLYGNYMQLRLCLVAMEIKFENPKAQEWQRALDISPRKKTETNTQWKNRLKGKAQQLFPKMKIILATADALLISEYGRRVLIKQGGMLRK